ncbi:PepSY domain-containing protein [Tumebacillus flagellatus]|uniref:Uncharacterized protein n=1 Tax=Tumebacillus flagellatus TaxID=1157490 RepID=A0A074LW39_9BACL|nr:PepSY domain-containing protein [Tumebacillus flagellatus]KEO84800.1 hypothetical protein EL26_01965 [Tumebacillus flagellatus]
MKKKYIAVTAVGLLLGGLAWFSGAAMTPAEAGLHTRLDRQALAADGITLDVPDHDPQIVQNDALERAKAAYGGMLAGNWDVQVEYHLISGPTVISAKNARHLERTPCYLVLFTRTDPPAPGSPRLVHVLVDAQSGEVLQAFSHR